MTVGTIEQGGSVIGRTRGFLRRLSRNDAGAILIAFTLATLLLRLGGNVVLTRLLTPRAFGVMGMIASVMMVLTLLSDLGFASFIIRHEKGDDPRFLDVIWTIRLIQSAVQAAAMLAGAVPIALLLDKPAMALPIAACAPLFILAALCPMSALLAQRQGQVRKTCTIDLGALGIQIAVNLLLAIVLRDYRALVIGLYVNAIVKALLTLAILPQRSHLRFDREMAREFFGFSRVIMVSTLIALLISQSDKILFARLFSFANFGVYILAANLALAVQPFGRNYVLRVFYPMVSRIWRDSPEQLPAVFYGARRRMYPMLFAGFGLAIGGAPLLFAILFDPRYEYGWIFLSILMLRTALDLDSFAGAQTLLAIGQTTTTLHANILRLVVLALAVLPLYKLIGLIALPMALALSEAAATIYVNMLLRKAGCFRAGPHSLHYGVLMVAIIVGALLSVLTVPSLMLGVVKGIG